MLERQFDRREPKEWNHVSKYRAFADMGPFTVEKILNIPRQYRAHYDQGQEGACVGFSQSWMMSILNRMKFDARWLYQQAQLVDEWVETPPEEGTSLKAGFDILRAKGHRRVWDGAPQPENVKHGIFANRWAINVDEVRKAIYDNAPVNFGVNWYSQFSNPEQRYRIEDVGQEKAATLAGFKRYDYWIGVNEWGGVQGGHAITCVGASDRRQAFALCNTWGESYPFIVWLPYVSFTRLLAENGEAGIVTDR